MATITPITSRAFVSTASARRSTAPAVLPANVFSLGQARVNRETPRYLKSAI